MQITVDELIEIGKIVVPALGILVAIVRVRNPSIRNRVELKIVFKSEPDKYLETEDEHEIKEPELTAVDPEKPKKRWWEFWK